MVATPTRPDSSTDTSFVDLEHVGPGTPAGSWLRRFWHPIYRSEDLPAGRAKPVRLLGEDFTLYRGESGDVHAVGFRCAHRGTQMSTGWVEGDNLRCFYHGWVYDGNGQCVEQPAEPEPFCNRIKIKSYPVEDYLGLVFVFMGEDPVPPLPRYGMAEKATLREAGVQLFPFSYRQALDNKQDLAHYPFVHLRTGGSRQTKGRIDRSAGIPEQVFEETDWGFSASAAYNNGVTALEHILMPNIYLHNSAGPTHGSSPDDGWKDTIKWTVPIDDEHMAYVVLWMANASPEQIKVYRQRRDETLANAPEIDIPGLLKEVLEGRLRPEDVAKYGLVDGVARLGQGVIPDRTQDHLGHSDRGTILYRRIFEREIRALAEGRPIKQWSWPLDLHATWARDGVTVND
jgi:5,5'-dehydrodivanillate O-demethylase oxygenase subunit